MWETLSNANGCGLAAPQIGKPIKLFIVDSKSTYEGLQQEDRYHYFSNNDTGIIETFINAQIIDYSKEVWEDEEGCLSIPNISQRVIRSRAVTIKYLDSEFKNQVKSFEGVTARMVQHEYDHTNGILYIDLLNHLTKKIITGKLKKISKGSLSANYPMIYK